DVCKTALGRRCRKSRKSNDAKNLANCEFWTTPPLRCSVVPIRRSVIIFFETRCGPSRRCARNPSGALENLTCYPPKGFFDSIGPKRRSRSPSRLQSESEVSGQRCKCRGRQHGTYCATCRDHHKSSGANSKPNSRPCCPTGRCNNRD